MIPANFNLANVVAELKLGGNDYLNVKDYQYLNSFFENPIYTINITEKELWVCTTDKNGKSIYYSLNRGSKNGVVRYLNREQVTNIEYRLWNKLLEQREQIKLIERLVSSDDIESLLNHICLILSAYTNDESNSYLKSDQTENRKRGENLRDIRFSIESGKLNYESGIKPYSCIVVRTTKGEYLGSIKLHYDKESNTFNCETRAPLAGSCDTRDIKIVELIKILKDNSKWIIF